MKVFKIILATPLIFSALKIIVFFDVIPSSEWNDVEMMTQMSS